MSYTEETLKKVSDLLIAVECVNEQLSTVQELYQQCEQIKEQIEKTAESTEKKLDNSRKKTTKEFRQTAEDTGQQLRECEEKIQHLIGSTEQQIRKYEASLQTIAEQTCIVEIVKKLEDMEKRIARMETLKMARANMGTVPEGCVLDLIEKQFDRWPIKLEKANWFNGFHFRVESLDLKYAHGGIWIGEEFKQPSKILLRDTEYTIFKSKAKKKTYSVPEDGFYPLPESIEDDDLPF